jgi:dipeptidyl aminopeptidase/acylaminoacyl peptidase
VCKRDGSNPLPKTNLDSLATSGPWWSPEGQRIAFNSHTLEGAYDIYVIDLDGGPVRQLTTDPAWDTDPRWSRDGQWIYFDSDRSGRAEVWKIPAEGGEPIQVTTKGGWSVEESLDGEHLYYVKDDERTLWRRPIAGGEETLLLENVERPYWCLGERGVYVLDRDSKPPCVRLFDFQTLELTLVAELSEDAAVKRGGGHHISVSPGDEWLVYQTFTWEEDIKLVENFQ